MKKAVFSPGKPEKNRRSGQSRPLRRAAEPALYLAAAIAAVRLLSAAASRLSVGSEASTLFT